MANKIFYAGLICHVKVRTLAAATGNGDYVEDDGKKQSTERIVKSRPLKIAPAVTTKTPMSKKSHTSTHTHTSKHTYKRNTHATPGEKL